MAATYTLIAGPNSIGDRMVTLVSITGDTSYAAYAVTAAKVGLGVIEAIASVGSNTAAAAYIAEYDKEASTIAFYTGASAATGNVSTYTLYLLCIGY